MPPRRLPRLAPTALAALLALLSSSPGAQSSFTGARPVYVGSWFNGSFTEVREFEFALDWQGWCNARPGASCQRIAFWGQAQNWSTNTLPDAATVASVPLGQVLRLGDFQSIYQGPLSGSGRVGQLTVSGRFENSGYLRAGSSQIADYFAFIGGGLETSGLSHILNLSSPQATFRGSGGSTRVDSWSEPSLNLLVGSEHRLQLTGPGAVPASVLTVRLEPLAVLENTGSLQLGAGSQLMLQGTANAASLPRFDNLGTLSGSFGMGALRFNNLGLVQLDAGEVATLGYLGTHSGSFSGGVNSSMAFGGFAGPGMVFSAGSQMASEGRVQVLRGSHRVDGQWRSASLELTGNGAALHFTGPAPSINQLLVQGEFGAQASFAHGAGIAALGAVTLDGGNLLIESGSAAQSSSLNLQRGAVIAEGTISNNGVFVWLGGRLGGSGQVASPGPIHLQAGATPRQFSLGLFLQQSDLRWEGGSFNDWSGLWQVQNGKRFDIQGDFSATGSGQLSLDQALLLKSAGSGRAELDLFVVNAGELRADHGVLALTDRSVHANGSRLSANAANGARIELGGTVRLDAGLQQQGRIDIVADRLSISSGLSFAPSTPASVFAPTHLELQFGAGLTLPGALALGGELINRGQVVLGGALSVGGAFINEGSLSSGGKLIVQGDARNQGALSIAGDLLVNGNFEQAGTLTRPRSGRLEIGGDFLSLSTLDVEDASLLVGGRLQLHAPLTLIGASSSNAGALDNRSTLNLLLNSGSGLAIWGTVDNHGTIRVDGAGQFFSHGERFSNHGQVSNEGTWYAGDLRLLAGSRFDNLGVVFHSGADSELLAGSLLAGSGRFENQGGSLHIHAGATLQTDQLYVQTASGDPQRPALTRVNGLLDAPAGVQIWDGELRGAGSIHGNVFVGANAKWLPGNSPGTMHINGDAYLEGLLAIEIESPAVHDRLVLSGGLYATPGAQLLFKLAPGFQAQDGEIINWAQASFVDVATANVQVDGLSGFSASLLSGSLQLLDDSATALPTSGNVVVAAGTVRFNAQPEGNGLLLGDMLVDGTLSNRSGAELGLQSLHVSASGQVLQRGQLGVAEPLINQGHWRGAAGSSTSAGQFDNEGSYQSAGMDSYGAFSNRAGATQRVDGQFMVIGPWDNAGHLTIAGEARHLHAQMNNSGPLTIEAGGLLQVDRLVQSSGPDGALLRVDGRLEASDMVQLLDGELQGTGVLAANVQMGSGNRLAPGHPDGSALGTLSIEGSLSAWGSEIFLEVGADGSHDALQVGSTLNWSGFSVSLVFNSLSQPTLGSFQLVTAGSYVGALCAGCWQVVTGDATSGYTYWGQGSPFNDISIRFGADGMLTVAAVPEPQTWALMLGGLFAVAFYKRRGGSPQHRG